MTNNEGLWAVFNSLLEELGLCKSFIGNGRPPVPDREVFQAYLWILRTGSQWDCLPECYPSARTCFRRLKEWRDYDVMTLTLERVMPDIPDVGIIDASFQRARCGGDGIGLTRHGKGCVLQVITGLDSLPVLAHVGPAGPAEVKRFSELLEEEEFELPSELLADAAYDSDQLAMDLDRRKCKLIPRTSKRRKDYETRHERTGARLKERWPVERLFAWLTAYRGVVTRYARTLHNHAQAVYLALAQIIVQQNPERRFCQ